jgi:glycine/D-amino acid oxidase-like deaminating enzyme
VTTTADAIIIGGGIHGASLAFHLAEGGLRPLVVERDFIAAGATGRSSGLVRMHYDLEVESRLAWQSFQYFRNWAERVGGDCGFTRTGFLMFVRPAYVEQLKANVAIHQQIGIPTLLVTAEDVSRLAPSFSTDDIELAAYEPESGYADPNGTTRGLLDAAREGGAHLIQGCEVTGILVQGGTVSGVETSRGVYSAPIVVNAAGAWAARVAALVGLDLPIKTWRHDTMFVLRPPALGLDHPTVIDDLNSMYFRPETGHLTLIGLEDSNPIGGAPDGNIDRALPGFVEKAVERICKRIPAMEEASVHSAHGGYDGITPDQRAIIGQAGPDGFYLDCGFSGTGFKIAPAVGRCLAELILNGKSETVDIGPLHPDRFERGEHLESQTAYESIWRE